MPAFVMLPVEINGIRGQQPMHETAQISSWCLQYKMDMLCEALRYVK